MNKTSLLLLFATLVLGCYSSPAKSSRLEEESHHPSVKAYDVRYGVHESYEPHRKSNKKPSYKSYYTIHEKSSKPYNDEENSYEVPYRNYKHSDYPYRKRAHKNHDEKYLAKVRIFEKPVYGPQRKNDIPKRPSYKENEEYEKEVYGPMKEPIGYKKNRDSYGKSSYRDHEEYVERERGVKPAHSSYPTFYAAHEQENEKPLTDQLRAGDKAEKSDYSSEGTGSGELSAPSEANSEMHSNVETSSPQQPTTSAPMNLPLTRSNINSLLVTLRGLDALMAALQRARNAQSNAEAAA